MNKNAESQLMQQGYRRERERDLTSSLQNWQNRFLSQFITSTLHSLPILLKIHSFSSVGIHIIHLLYRYILQNINKAKRNFPFAYVDCAGILEQSMGATL
jgi:hypothetical protein